MIETLVSLAIFSVIMVVTGGLILAVLNSNKQNQAINGVVNNLNYSIESMVRDIKTGYSYKCNYDELAPDALIISNFKELPHNCTPGSAITNITLISTITGAETLVRYDFIPAVTDSSGYIQKTTYSLAGSASVYPLTDRQNIDIQQLSFKVDAGIPLYENDIQNTAVDETGPSQPYVFVLIKGTAKVNAINISDFFVQTYVSQRLPNLI